MFLQDGCVKNRLIYFREKVSSHQVQDGGF